MNPPRKKRISATSEEWLLHAQSDLKLARLGLNEDVLPEQICFHAQQAVEKAVKAVLLFHKVDFPFTHDLQDLLEILETAGIHVPPDLSDVSILTPYAVETRYPGYWGDISESDVSEAVSFAEKAIEWAEEVICNKKL